MAKADAGLVPLIPVPVQMDELVRECFADAQILAHASGIRVVLEHCDSILVLGDSHRLRQLLLNLSDNAVKYNQSAGWISVSLHSVGDWAELLVSNSGPGISPDIAQGLRSVLPRPSSARQKCRRQWTWFEHRAVDRIRARRSHPHPIVFRADHGDRASAFGETANNMTSQSSLSCGIGENSHCARENPFLPMDGTAQCKSASDRCGVI